MVHILSVVHVQTWVPADTEVLVLIHKLVNFLFICHLVAQENLKFVLNVLQKFILLGFDEVRTGIDKVYLDVFKVTSELFESAQDIAHHLAGSWADFEEVNGLKPFWNYVLILPFAALLFPLKSVFLFFRNLSFLNYFLRFYFLSAYVFVVISEGCHEPDAYHFSKHLRYFG